MQGPAQLPAITPPRLPAVGAMDLLPAPHLQHACCLRSLQCVASTI
jgi:hypothetical protein